MKEITMTIWILDSGCPHSPACCGDDIDDDEDNNDTND